MRFPVIAFSKGKSISIAKTEYELGHCNKIALRNGLFENLIVIDSDGNQFEVKSAKKTGTRGPFKH